MSSENPLPSETETLEDILHHYLTLHERWIEERQTLGKHNAELGKLVTRLSAQMDKFRELEEGLKAQVSRSIHGASQQMAEKALQEFNRKVMEEVELSIRDLKKASRQTVEYVNDIQTAHTASTVYMIIGLFLLPIIASLLIFWLLSPKPLMPLTDSQFSTYEAGQMLQSVWPKLTKKQKEFLTELNEGKINNHGKKLESMGDPADENNGDENNSNNEYYPQN